MQAHGRCVGEGERWRRGIAKPGYLKVCDTHEDAFGYVGGAPVLSPLAALAKTKPDDHGKALWTK